MHCLGKKGVKVSDEEYFKTLTWSHRWQDEPAEMGRLKEWRLEESLVGTTGVA